MVNIYCSTKVYILILTYLLIYWISVYR